MAIRRILTALLICSGYGAAQIPPPSLTTIYNFTGVGSNGVVPEGLVIGSGGVLYGTTAYGGEFNHGTVFSLTPPASPGSSWTETVLYSFQGDSGDGANPNTALVIGAGGVLYGATLYYGVNNVGTVFSLTPPALPGGQWTESVYCFPCCSYGGVGPNGLTIGPTGTLFGTTYGGGASDAGTVFALVPPATPGGEWAHKVLYSFQDGGAYTGVAMGSGGVLYGTTGLGGAFGYGVVFALAPPMIPGGTWTETELYSFPAGGGQAPQTGVVIGEGGVLYGATSVAAYSLTPPSSPGGPWIHNVVHEFPAQGDEYPAPSPLTLGETGVLYGTTRVGETAFALEPPAFPGAAWTEVLLYMFIGGPDGYHPSGLVIGSGGVLYGMTYSGGLYGEGTIFALTE